MSITPTETIIPHDATTTRQTAPLRNAIPITTTGIRTPTEAITTTATPTAAITAAAAAATAAEVAAVSAEVEAVAAVTDNKILVAAMVG